MNLHESDASRLIYVYDRITNQFSRMDFNRKSPSQSFSQSGNQSYMEHQSQRHSSPCRESFLNHSLLNHVNTSNIVKQHHNLKLYMDKHNYRQQTPQIHQNIFLKSQYNSPKTKHVRRRARSECLSPLRAAQQHGRESQADMWRMHHQDDQNKYDLERFKYREQSRQIDEKHLPKNDFDHDNEFSYQNWHQRRRFRASSESATYDYYYHEVVEENRDRRIILSRPHVTNKNNFSVLVNNTTHYSYSPKSKARSHYVGHKNGVVRISSPLHNSRIHSWKSYSNSISNSIASKSPEDDEDDDSDDDVEDEPLPKQYGLEDQTHDDDMTDPEDNYESSLSEKSANMQKITINTDCVQGGRVLESPFAPSLFPFVPPYITFATFDEKGPEIPAIIHKQLKWKLTTITPLLVRKILLNTGFRLMKKPNDWIGTWGKHMKSPCFKTLHSYQKFNHLPGSFQIGRKDRCWRNLQTLMSRHGKKEFGFMPRTYIIPQDLNLLRQTWHRYSQKNAKWIIKPPASARGTGIKVINSWSQIPKRKPLIVQRYIERPLLINGSKFDLRLYVLVSSLNPLRVYMHTDGLARFASVKYSERSDTLNDRYMHLTNYSINKLSNNYDKNDDANACKGMKWTIKSLWTYLRNRGVNTERLWGALRNLVLRTVLAGEGPINSMIKANLQNKYNSFELFGIDVLLDSELVPWLLEVNISPSLHSASGLDMAVKGPLVTALLNTVLYQIPPKIPLAHQAELARELNLKTPLCYDKRIFTSTLTKEERQKHQHFTQKTMLRENYIPAILENLTPDDVRCLIITEDELARCQPLERIFPAPNSYKYLSFTEQPRYYNALLDAWEHRYSKKRENGIALLRSLCWKKIHLKVPPTTVQRDCNNKDLEKIIEDESPQEETSTANIPPTVENLEVEVNPNENRDTSNMAQVADLSPKKSPTETCEGKYLSNFFNCLPIADFDSEVVSIKQ